MNKYQKEIEKLLSLSLAAHQKELGALYKTLGDEITQEMLLLSKEIEVDDKFSKKLQEERLSAIRSQMYQRANEVANAEKSSLYDHLNFVGDTSFNALFYEFEMTEKISPAFSMLAEKELNVIINTPVAGRKLSTRLKGNTEKMKKNLNRVLVRGFGKGWSTEKMARQIAEIGGASYRRGLTIARTEGGRVSSVARQQSQNHAQQIGIWVQKKWVSMLDGDTRTNHRVLDGQVREVDAYFEVGGNKALQPHMFGIASEDCNCRCVSISVIKGMDPKLRRDNESNEVINYKNYNDWYENKLTEREHQLSSSQYGANLDYVRSSAFQQKISEEPRLKHIAESVTAVSRKILQHRNGTPFEDYYLLDYQSGKTIALSNQARIKKETVYNNQVKQAFRDGEFEQYISIHNHPSGYPPSLSDIASLSLASKNNTVSLGLTIGHDGSVYWYTKANKKFPAKSNSIYTLLIEKYRKLGYNEVRAQELALKDFSSLFDFKFGKVGE